MIPHPVRPFKFIFQVYMILNGKRSSNWMLSTWVQSCFLPFFNRAIHLFVFFLLSKSSYSLPDKAAEKLQGFSTPVYCYHAPHTHTHTYIYTYTYINTYHYCWLYPCTQHKSYLVAIIDYTMLKKLKISTYPMLLLMLTVPMYGQLQTW